MKKRRKKFLKILKKYFKLYPETRITQALFNLGVTEKAAGDKYFFIDNYNQNDKVTLTKVEEQYEKAYKNFFKGIIPKQDEDQGSKGRENKPKRPE